MKKYFFIILGLVLILILIISTINIFHTKKNPPVPISNPSPTAIPGIPTSATKNSLQIISTQPDDNTQDVPLTQAIHMIFDTNISTQDLSFTIVPSIPTTLTKNGNEFIITPSQQFDSHTQYIYYFTYKGWVLPSRSFTTIGTGPVVHPDTNDTTFTQQANQYELTHNPALYISNYLPYTGDTFTVSENFTQDNNPHRYFIVRLTGTDTNQSKQDFFNWLKSLGLTDQQTGQLDIQYQ